jgi:uncharacterized protein (TIGR03437 family)
LRAHRFALKLGLLFLLAGALAGQALFVKPVKVLGDPNFTGTAANPLNYDSIGPNWVEGRELNEPLGIALDNSVSPPIVYIADTANNRVLGYQYATQLTSGAYADRIIGQPDRFTNVPEGPGTALSTGLRSPTGLAVDSAGNLYVADSGNNRILRYAKPFSQPAEYQFPDLIIGQTSFSTATGDSGGVKPTTLLLSSNGSSSFFPHTGMAFDSAGNLWVADTGNSRVLRYPAAVLVPNQNGPAADTALGQADLLSNVAANSRTTKIGLAFPTSVSFDSAGNMLVADGLNRVVVYAPNSGTNYPSIRILGVAVPAAATASAINIGNVTSAVAAGNNIFVADSGNNRVLVYQAVSLWPPESTQFSPSAFGVIGQSTFSASMANQGGLTSAFTLSSPVEVASSGTEVFVVDAGNNRVAVFPSNVSDITGQPVAASRVIGQLGTAYAAPNLVVGEEFFTAGGSTSPSGSAILDLSATPPHLYVADTMNNRVLGFKNFTSLSNGQAADLVIGQPDLFHTAVNYPTNLATMPNAQGLNAPSSLAVDSAGNLYVADTLNARILRFPAPFASGTTSLETADLVVGQSDFVSIIPDPTPLTMAAPISLALTKDGADASVANSGYLVAVDAAQNRVLLFGKPFSSGMSAATVLGQPDFNSSSASATSAGLAAPRGVAIDPQDRILVADTGNSRVLAFGPVQTLSNDASPSFILTNGLTTPFSIGMAQSGEFWVADPGQNGLLHFPSIDNLPIDNYKSDASQPAVSPRSAFVDPYNNLLVADGINRILYFAPGLGVVNAANYIAGRALAPGASAAIFPAVSTNILATGTASAPSGVFPLPTVLAGTQVFVNNTASSLFYVSPGQINLPLSMSLPSGGTVDLQVVAQSTGQIYAGAEIALNSASPGLFTAGGTGTGQVAATNSDGSINSATNPDVRGNFISLYGTGQGFVANAPPDGQAATGPVATAVTPQILLGGAYVPSANIQYSGLAPTLVGVWQINFQVPTTAPAGNNVPIIVLMNSIPNDNPSVPGQIATTIALK